MHRLIAVSYGYLKFALFCMLGSTALFALAGLSIKNPLVGSFIVLALIGAYFVVRSERGLLRRAKELDARQRDPKEQVKTWVEAAAFAQAATMLVSAATVKKITLDEPSLWVSGWTPTHTVPVYTEGRLDKEQLTAIIKDLKRYRDQLAHEGLYLVSVADRSPEEVVKQIKLRAPGGQTFKPIEVRYIVMGDRNQIPPISLMFLHEKKVHARIETAQKLLKDSFEMVRAGIEIEAKVTS